MDWATQHAIETGNIASPSPLQPGSTGGRTWTWVLGFAVCLVLAWLAVLFVITFGNLGAMADCGTQTCEDIKAQNFGDAGSVDSAYLLWAMLTTCVALIAAAGERWAAVLVVMASAATVVLSLAAPGPLTGHGTEIVGLATIPLLALSWRRLRILPR